jgi:hypothetical protein
VSANQIKSDRIKTPNWSQFRAEPETIVFRSRRTSFIRLLTNRIISENRTVLVDAPWTLLAKRIEQFMIVSNVSVSTAVRSLSYGERAKSAKRFFFEQSKINYLAEITYNPLAKTHRIKVDSSVCTPHLIIFVIIRLIVHDFCFIFREKYFCLCFIFDFNCDFNLLMIKR